MNDPEIDAQAEARLLRIERTAERGRTPRRWDSTQQCTPRSTWPLSMAPRRTTADRVEAGSRKPTRSHPDSKETARRQFVSSWRSIVLRHCKESYPKDFGYSEINPRTRNVGIPAAQ